MLRWWSAACLCLLSFCAPASPHDAALARLLELPPDLRARFDARVRSIDSPHRRMEAMVDFIFAPEDMGMTYAFDATHSVTESWATRRANCVGFTLLFLALAREAGFEAWPREIRQTLSWRRSEYTLIRNGHVNAAVRVGSRTYRFDVARDLVIAQHDPVTIPDMRLLAHYFNNTALDALERGRLDEARDTMQRALRVDPDYATHWSNAGVIHLRRGDVAAARAAQEQALALDPDEPVALHNLANLARREGDGAKEREYRARLDRVQRRDPLHHYLLALEQERAGDDHAAVRHYRDAIRLHGREPRFHLALADAYARLGDAKQSERSRRRAERLSRSGW